MTSPENELAIRGGRPIRDRLLPYGRQTVSEADIAAVAEVLRSDYLTTGPKVAEFERAFASHVGTREAVAVNSGTAALHAMMHALRIGPGDEVVVPCLTFAATANSVLYVGGTPVFADVDGDTLLLTAESAVERITPRTKAIIAVDYAGQPCEYDALAALARDRRLAFVADACHAAGASYRGRRVGGLADLSAFSFHPVKHLTTCEGGMVTTDNADLAARMRIFRNHGITHDHRQREALGSLHYEMRTLGFNYRISDVQCALGLSQLKNLDAWVARRGELVARYGDLLGDLPEFQPLAELSDRTHAWHLFVVRCLTDRLGWTRDQIYAAMRAEGIGVNVHYLPVHLHPYYREHHHTGPGLCPRAEAVAEQILTLPLFPNMKDADVEDVVRALRKIRDAQPPAEPRNIEPK